MEPLQCHHYILPVSFVDLVEEATRNMEEEVDEDFMLHDEENDNSDLEDNGKVKTMTDLVFIVMDYDLCNNLFNRCYLLMSN